MLEGQPSISPTKSSGRLGQLSRESIIPSESISEAATTGKIRVLSVNTIRNKNAIIYFTFNVQSI